MKEGSIKRVGCIALLSLLCQWSGVGATEGTFSYAKRSRVKKDRGQWEVYVGPQWHHMKSSSQGEKSLQGSLGGGIGEVSYSKKEGLYGALQERWTLGEIKNSTDRRFVHEERFEARLGWSWRWDEEFALRAYLGGGQDYQITHFSDKDTKIKESIYYMPVGLCGQWHLERPISVGLDLRWLPHFDAAQEEMHSKGAWWQMERKESLEMELPILIKVNLSKHVQKLRFSPFFHWNYNGKAIAENKAGEDLSSAFPRKIEKIWGLKLMGNITF